MHSLFVSMEPRDGKTDSQKDKTITSKIFSPKSFSKSSIKVEKKIRLYLAQRYRFRFVFTFSHRDWIRIRNTDSSLVFDIYVSESCLPLKHRPMKQNPSFPECVQYVHYGYVSATTFKQTISWFRTWRNYTGTVWDTPFSPHLWTIYFFGSY